MKETILLCGECLEGDLNTITNGNEGWNVCPCCNAVEGSYYELFIGEYEELMELDYIARSQYLLEEELNTPIV